MAEKYCMWQIDFTKQTRLQEDLIFFIQTTLKPRILSLVPLEIKFLGFRHLRIYFNSNVVYFLTIVSWLAKYST